MYVRTDALLTTAGLVAALAAAAVALTTPTHLQPPVEVFSVGNATELPTSLSQVVNDFNWAWIKRDPSHALNVAEIDPSGWLDWAVGDMYSVTSDPELRAFIEFSAWKNSLIIPASFEAVLPHFFVSWYRNYIIGTVIFLLVGGVWSLGVYGCCRTCAFPPGQPLPTYFAMFEQIRVGQNAMFLYTWLPTFAEWLVERGYTAAYEQVGTVGLPAYCLWFVVYMVCVEFGVYWMHRLLHDIKPAYKYLHAVHHKYNKNNTLSPFASLAFHPVDGCLQALPYVALMSVIPMHFLTHEILLFFTAVWSTSIHDTVQMDSEPIMGAGYHEIHHTDYRHNYGQFTILFDWMFGTLLVPPGSSWASWNSTGGELKTSGRTAWDADRPDLEGKAKSL